MAWHGVGKGEAKCRRSGGGTQEARGAMLAVVSLMALVVTVVEWAGEGKGGVGGVHNGGGGGGFYESPPENFKRDKYNFH